MKIYCKIPFTEAQFTDLRTLVFHYAIPLLRAKMAEATTQGERDYYASRIAAQEALHELFEGVLRKDTSQDAEPEDDEPEDDEP